MRVHLSWPTVTPDPNLRVWRIYANPDREVDVKGRLIAEVPGTENETTVEVDEGWWRFRIVGVTRVETETAWETALAVIDGDFTARGPDDVPPTPAGVGAGAVGDGMLRAVVDAPDPLTKPHKIQLVGGPAADVTDPAMGHLLGEYVQGPADLQGADAPTLPSPSFPLAGQGRSDARKLWVRPVSAEGTPGTAVERSLVSPERAQVDRYVLASIDKTAGTYSGFAAPASSDAWEAAATYGFRARKFPTWGAGSADFGAWGAGGMLDEGFGRYVRTLKIPTNEFDLGASVLFQLDLYHEAHRRDADLPTFGEGSLLTAWPGEERELRGTPEGPGWFAREITWGGTPRLPLRQVAFEYVAGDSTPVAATESDWKRYVPGLWVKARYVRVRLRLVEPFPWYRLATGSVHVAVLRPRTWTSGSGSPEGAVAAPFGAVYVRTDVSPYALFLKTTPTGNTGWIEVARTSDLSGYLEAGDDAALLGSGSATSGQVLTADGAGGASFATPSGGTPSAHATSHEDGGSDEIDLTGLAGETATPQVPKIAALSSLSAVDRVADEVPVNDASASVVKRVTLRDLASGALDRSSAHVDVGPSSAAEVSIYSFSVPAGSLGTDRLLRLGILGTAKNFDGAGRAFQFRVKWGGATVIDASVNLANVNAVTTLEVQVRVQADGATNAQHVYLAVTLPTASAPATGSAGGAVPAGGLRTAYAAAAVDSTSDQTLEVSLQLGASGINLFADVEAAVLELV